MITETVRQYWISRSNNQIQEIINSLYDEKKYNQYNAMICDTFLSKNKIKDKIQLKEQLETQLENIKKDLDKVFIKKIGRTQQYSTTYQSIMKSHFRNDANALLENTINGIKTKKLRNLKQEVSDVLYGATTLKEIEALNTLIKKRLKSIGV